VKRADRGLGARRRGLAVLVVACVLCTGAGAAAAVLVKSPAQAAAESAPPPPDILTAKAEKRVISQAVISRGVVTASRHIEVTPGPQSDKGIGRSVVTKVRTGAGQKATTGQVLGRSSAVGPVTGPDASCAPAGTRRCAPTGTSEPCPAPAG
jgi:hypothetical protein